MRGIWKKSNTFKEGFQSRVNNFPLQMWCPLHLIEDHHLIKSMKFILRTNVLAKSCTRYTLRKKPPYSELFWSAFFPYFPAFGLNTERYSVSLRIQYGEILRISSFSVRMRENAEKMRTRITPNTDSFYAVTNNTKICK